MATVNYHPYRSEALRPGDWHRACGVWVKSFDVGLRKVRIEARKDDAKNWEALAIIWTPSDPVTGRGLDIRASARHRSSRSNAACFAVIAAVDKLPK